MDAGFKISGFAHLVLIGIAIFGAPLFSSDEENAIQISEVSLISLEDFASLTSVAPPVSETLINIIKPVEVEPTPVEVEPTPVEVEPTPVEVEPTPVEISDAEIEPTAPIASIDSIGELTPELNENTPSKPSDTISNIISETPKDPIKPEVSSKPLIIEVPSPEELEPNFVKEQEPASAVKESTTKTVTEAEERESELVPSSSSRPKRRPKNLKVVEIKKPDLKVEETKNPDLIKDAIARSMAEEKVNEVIVKDNQLKKVVGPPLTGGETNTLMFAIQQCWNVPVGLENDSSNIITMGIKLTQDGRLEGEPKRLAPNTGSGAGILQAYEAARRALIRCQPYDLPAEKYETWRDIEIVFNPEQMVLR